MKNFSVLTDVKDFLGISLTTTTHDRFLSSLLDRTTPIMQKYMGQKIFSDTYTDIFSGNGKTNELILNNYPIISITSVHEDADRNFTSSTLLTKDTDYLIVDEDDVDGENPGILLKLDGDLWQKGDKNIKIIYVAGYADNDLPLDLAQAQIDFVSFIFNNLDKRSGIDSFRLGQFTVKYTKETENDRGLPFRSIPKVVRDILDLYKDRRLISTENQSGV